MPRVPDVDRHVRLNLKVRVRRTSRRGADGCAVDVDRHLVALDDDFDLVGPAGCKGARARLRIVGARGRLRDNVGDGTI